MKLFWDLDLKFKSIYFFITVSWWKSVRKTARKTSFVRIGPFNGRLLQMGHVLWQWRRWNNAQQVSIRYFDPFFSGIEHFVGPRCVVLALATPCSRETSPSRLPKKPLPRNPLRPKRKRRKKRAPRLLWAYPNSMRFELSTAGRLRDICGDKLQRKWLVCLLSSSFGVFVVFYSIISDFLHGIFFSVYLCTISNEAKRCVFRRFFDCHWPFPLFSF